MHTKSAVQALLKRLGVYGRLRASAVYDLYWRIANTDVIAARDREVNFYRALFPGFKKGELIVDVGANHGFKTDIFLRLGARVVAVDPDELNQQMLRQQFLDYRLRKRPLIVVGCALSDRNAVQTMWVDEPGSGKNTLSSKWVETLRQDDQRFGQRFGFAEQKQVVTTTLDDLIAQHGQPHFVKIDVEGAEPNVLRGLHQPVPFVSFEINLPEFLPEGMECIELLRRLSASGRFNYIETCENGFLLPAWRTADEFADHLRTCHKRSVEVFWRSH